MNIGFFAVVAVTSAMLTGCITAQDRAARDDAKCQSFGAAPGTRAYYDCRMTMDVERQRRLRQAGTNLGQNLSRLGDKGGEPPSRSTSCTSRRVGSEVQTSCD